MVLIINSILKNSEIFLPLKNDWARQLDLHRSSIETAQTAEAATTARTAATHIFQLLHWGQILAGGSKSELVLKFVHHLVRKEDGSQ